MENFMNCSHISEEECVKQVNQEMFRKKRDLENKNCFLEPNGNKQRLRNEEHHKTFCNECDSCSKSLMCLSCGLIHCGRHDLSHAIDHYQELNHPVVIDCISFEFYCYECDDDVTLNFEPSIYSVIRSLRELFDRQDFVDYNDVEGNIENKKQNEIIKVDNIENLSNSLETTNITSTKTYADFHIPLGKPLSRKEKRAAKKNKRGKVSPMFVTPLNGHVIYGDDHLPENDNIKPKGLKNIGNTCYMNSVIQALTSLSSFRNFLNSLPPLNSIINEKEISKKNGNETHLTDELKSLMREITTSTYGNSTTPGSFRDIFISSCPRFRGFRQHDAHEFLRYLLDKIHTEQKSCSKIPNLPENVTAVSQFFEGFLQSSVICQKCRNCSNKVDEFMDISLDIPRINSNKLRLFDCLNLFFEKEILENGEKPDCSKCKMKQTSSKQMFIKQLPEILCLHLKRFRDNGTKLSSLIEFPLSSLALDAYLTENSDEPPCVYDLSSVIIHIGYGTDSGHYISFGRRGTTWYQFDDQQVRPTSETHVSKQIAYVLLYSKRLLKAPV